MFINVRSDENIKGFKIKNNEFKLTSYADDASYFLKKQNSADNLLITIKKFSKISGLEVTRSTSECLLLDYEMGLTGLTGMNYGFIGITIVNNLPIL